MPDTGAPHFIPFLDGTELVRAYPAFSEDLAEQVAEGLSAASVVDNIYVAQKTGVQSFSSAAADFVDVGDLELTITPKSVDSKFLVWAQVNIANETNGRRTENHIKVLRNGSEIHAENNVGGFYTVSDRDRALTPITSVTLDTPNTTSSFTYKVSATQAHDGSTSLTVFIDRRQVNPAKSGTSFLVAVEYS